MRAKLIVCLSLLLAWSAFSSGPVSAQVLIWSLPADEGAWIRFEGTYKQTRSRPNSNAGDEILEWRSELTISSVGRENAALTPGGEEIPCRWVEFKTETKPAGVDQKAGPADQYLYKVLIPEHRVIGKIIDDDKIPVTFLPIVKGYRRVGQRAVEPVTEKALAVYPTIALVTYYPDLEAAGDGEQLTVGTETIEARQFKGTRAIVRNNSRSTNAAGLWRSDAVPFGLARFQVSLTTEQKQLSETAADFQRVSQVEVEMSAVAVGNEARSDLPDSN